MKNYKILLTSAISVLCLASFAPVVAFGEEQEVSDTEKTQYMSEWVTDEDGRIFYYNENGEVAVGEKEIDGELYLFSKNGVLKTGWRTVGGQRRYYDPETGKPVYGKLNECGDNFYIEKENGKIENTVFTDEYGDMYIAGEKGALILDEGITKMNGSSYYVSEGGKLAVGEVMVDGVPYVFGDDGKELSGWQTVGGKEYYYDTDTGEIKLGLVNTGDGLYYIDLDEGKKTGVIDIDGVEYLFDEDTGKMQTGLLQINDNIRYFYEDGTFAKGVTDVNGKAYLFNDNGNLLTGFRFYQDKLYFSSSNGVLSKGLIEKDGEKYFFGDDYSAQQGIIEVNGDKYLFGAEYKMLKGKQEYGGNTYCLDTNTGKMLTGRLVVDGKKYYFNPDDGTMHIGWMTFDEGQFYFCEDGTAASGITEIDGKKYYFHPDTLVLTKGRLIINGKKYYFSFDDGVMQTGWVTLDDGKYFFDNDGVMVTGWKTINGKKYYFNETTGKLEKDKIVQDYNLTDDGSAVELSAVQKRAKSIISSIGKTPDAIYDYVCKNNEYRSIEETKTLSQINSTGWQYFANYALDNRYVVSYYFAAVTDLLFQQAGLTSRVVQGTGRDKSDYYWNQVYDSSTDTWKNYDTCNKYKAVAFSYLQSLNYTFYQYIYPKFY